MDPITQGTLGAAFAQTRGGRLQLLKVAFIGALGGMAPDLDVLIRSAKDPLLFLEYHRHFTHSLFFIPIGGPLVGLLAFLVFGRRWSLRLKDFVIWSTMGYATHALLDGCTSYGTQLLWPLSDTRFSWDTVSVVDPLFTLPLLAAVVAAVVRRQRAYAWAGCAWALFYLSLGFVQHERATAMANELAHERGHEPGRLEVKPSFANLLVWKTIYTANGRFYVDAVKPGVLDSEVWQGQSLPQLDVQRDFPWLDPQSQQARDIKRFDRFSAGFTAVSPNDRERIIDIRYSLLPHEINALWGIALSPDAGAEEHVEYYTARNDSAQAAATLWSMFLE